MAKKKRVCATPRPLTIKEELHRQLCISHKIIERLTQAPTTILQVVSGNTCFYSTYALASMYQWACIHTHTHTHSYHARKCNPPPPAPNTHTDWRTHTHTTHAQQSNSTTSPHTRLDNRHATQRLSKAIRLCWKSPKRTHRWHLTPSIIHHFLTRSVSISFQVLLSPYGWTQSFHICAERNTVNIYHFFLSRSVSISQSTPLSLCLD